LVIGVLEAVFYSSALSFSCSISLSGGCLNSLVWLSRLKNMADIPETKVSSMDWAASSL